MLDAGCWMRDAGCGINSDPLIPNPVDWFMYGRVEGWGFLMVNGEWIIVNG